MIALSISNGTATAISVADSGHSGYVLASWQPGRVERENQVAVSRFVDGGALTATRSAITTIDASIYAYGTSYAHLMGMIDTLGSALGQFGYTITETYSGGSAVHTCLPGNYAVDYNPSLLRANMAVIAVSIPRQP